MNHESRPLDIEQILQVTEIQINGYVDWASSEGEYHYSSTPNELGTLHVLRSQDGSFTASRQDTEAGEPLYYVVAENISEDATNMLAWSPSYRELVLAQRIQRSGDEYDAQMLEVSTTELEKVTPRMVYMFGSDREAQSPPEQPFDITFEDVVDPEQQRIRGVLDLLARSGPVMSYGIAQRILLRNAQTAEDLAEVDNWLKGALGPDGKPGREKTQALVTAAMFTSLGSLASGGLLSPESPALDRLRLYRQQITERRMQALRDGSQKPGVRSDFRGSPLGGRRLGRRSFPLQSPRSSEGRETSPAEDDEQ